MRLLNRFICPECRSGFVEVYEASTSKRVLSNGKTRCTLETRHYATCDCLTKRKGLEDGRSKQSPTLPGARDGSDRCDRGL